MIIYGSNWSASMLDNSGTPVSTEALPMDEVNVKNA